MGLFDQKSMDESVKDQGDVGCAFDWKGIVHQEFVPRSQMGNKQIYQEGLARLREAVRWKRLELWETRLGSCTTTMRRLTRRSSSTLI